jgi:hypothetical protein
MEVEKIKWELIEPKHLSLSGTKITVVYCGGGWPFHVHRKGACHGVFERLDPAKQLACELVDELMQMGMDP